MTSDTFATKKWGAVYRGQAEQKHVSQAIAIAEAGIKAAYAVRKTSSGLYLCKEDEVCCGIVDGKLGGALDTAYDVADDAEYFLRGFSQIVAAWYGYQSPAVNLNGGEDMALCAIDGMLKKFAYTDGTQKSDSKLDIIGNFVGNEIITGSTSNNQLIEIVMN